MSNLIILGASTRAAAMSARRAGWTPWCADLFADVDLERIATVRKIPADEYPDGLLDAIRDAPPGPVMYTGALENRPDLIERIDRRIFGNSADVVRRVRTPELWNRCVPSPRVSTTPPTDGRWLLKPRKSGGGWGVRAYGGQTFDPRTHFLQEQIDGTSVAAIYVGVRGEAFFCGVTEQLVGTSWLNSRGYQYSGSIGPLHVDPYPWQTLGSWLVRSFELNGVFGLDAIVREGVPWPVEINPRYTASVEIIERSRDAALLLTPTPRLGLAGAAARVCGKAILFARNTFAFPASGPWNEDADFADIPHAGEVIEQGRPVLTIFAEGAEVEDCRRALQEKAQALDRRLWG
jgi:predicted ATP-grasp superfamily ATP-dependent carboligase